MECGVYVRNIEKHVMYCDKGIQDNSVVERSFPSRNTITKKMRNVDSSNPNYFSYKRGKMTYKMYQCRHCDFRTFRNLVGIETHVEEMHGKVEDSVAIPEPDLVEVKVEDATADDDDCIEAAETNPREVCNVGETLVKTEVVDLGHFSTPTFSIFEDEEESDPVPILSEKSTPAFELGSASDFGYRCPYCPFKHNFTRSFENHMPVHATGSNAVACPDCGVYVFQENLVEHRKLDLKRALAPPKVRKKSVRPRKKVITTKEKKDEKVIPSGYSSHIEQDGKRGRLVYSCHHCPFTVKGGRSQIESHLEVHAPGSPAIPCEICGFYVYPERMNWHLSNRHHQQFKKACSKLKQKRPPSNPYFVTVKMSKSEFVQYPKKEHRCRKCPFKTLTYGKIAVHVKLHEEGSTGIPCEVCQEFVLPEQMELHRDTNHQDCVRQELEELNVKKDSVEK
ncbi:putative zinc finger protein [Orchesella cincta]|uniref:Putative zinc finger protein n=1 Tax=Orchesella cincta TaxID=48709 RepID=A0A1D2MFT1_ORCCI|nr:putative zinc finger protein [Orchesella cincta]